MLPIQFSRNLEKMGVIFRENGIAKLFYFLYMKLNRNSKPQEIRFLGKNIWVRPGTPDLNVAHTCLSGEFHLLSTSIDTTQHGIIIDAGGYIGTAAIALADIFPNAHVISLEPSDDNFAILQKNVADHSRITAFHVALVSQNQTGPLRLRDRGRGEWGFTIDSDGSYGSDEVICTASAMTLSQVLEKFSATSALVVKMDIEGAERDILLKSDQWLPRTEVLFIELHPDMHSDILEIYESACSGRSNSRSEGEKFMSIRFNG